MARVQTQYQSRGEQLNAVQAPTIQAQQARFDPNDSGAFQLAKALGALNTEGFNSQLQSTATAQMTKDRLAAESYANGLTVEELGKQIKDGSMLPSRSPAFMAALQHIHGENSQNTFERDTLGKLQTGELKFGSQQEMDQYITEHRNEALKGQSQYTVAGFDKGYNAFREKAINANANRVNQESVERGVQESSDNLGNVLLQVTTPDFKGDAAQSLADRYQLLRKTSLLREDAAKQALQGLTSSIASSGNQDLLNAFLDKKLDNGITVRSVLGGTHAATLTQHAEAQNDKAQRQRVDVELRPFLAAADKGELDHTALDAWTQKNERWVTTSTLHAITQGDHAARERAMKELAHAQMLNAAEKSVAEANQATTTALRTGNFMFLPQQKVLSPTGEVKDFDQEGAAAAVLTKDAEQAKMDLPTQVKYWATNGVKNPEWEKQIKGAASNIASVGWAYDGKNVGKLNPQGEEGINRFMQINATHPAYAEKLVGSKKDYETLSNIEFMMTKGGMPNANDAAALVNQANRSGVDSPDYGSMTQKVTAAVDAVVNPHWYSGRVAWFDGLFGNSETNLASVSSVIRQRAELLVRSGQFKDATAAVEASVKYLANPAVTTKINNTLYFNKDLPAVPKGEEPGKWMERFIKEVPGKSATDQKMKGDVRLEPEEGGGYVAWIGGQPLQDPNGNTLHYRKDQVGQWINSQYKADLYKATDARNFQMFQKRLESEAIKALGDSSLPGAGQSGRDQMLKTIGSREAYDQYLKSGSVNKSLKELTAEYRKSHPAPAPWEPFKGK